MCPGPAIDSAPVSIRINSAHSGIVFALVRDVHAELCDKVQGRKGSLVQVLSAGPVDDMVTEELGEGVEIDPVRGREKSALGIAEAAGTAAVHKACTRKGEMNRASIGFSLCR